MLVVADSSPLNILIRIDCAPLLEVIFARVAIPEEVRAELSDPRAPAEVCRFIATPPQWLEVHRVETIECIASLATGEDAAIALARVLSADAVLMDERDGRREATTRGLVVIGTLGILELAATRGLVDSRSMLDRLRQSDFRIDQRLIDAMLKRLERA